jgi:hypothetical protein
MEDKSKRVLNKNYESKLLKILGFPIFGLIFFSVLMFHPYSKIFAQKDSSRIIVNAEVIGNDTLPVMVLNPYDVIEKPDPKAIKKLNEMNRLFTNVYKVLPYARIAKATLDEINDTIATMSSEHERKVFIKQKEKEMKERFEKELKNLTIDQGRILIKLIDRETGETSYELVKELRGSLTATFWQGMAHLFGSNLKATYDSVGEDRAVEQIIRQIDSTGFKPIHIKKAGN